MNQESHPPVELARRVSTAEAVVAAASEEAPRAVPASGVGTRGVASAIELSPTSLLKALRRRQTLALGVALLAIAISGPAAWYLVPAAKYKTQARLQLAAQPPKVLFRTVETDTNGDDYKRYQNTQLTLVKSQLVLNAALVDKSVSKYAMIRDKIDPIDWLKENLRVEFVGASEVMEISLSGDDPVEIAGIVNAVKKAYMDEVVNVDTKRRADRFAKLKQIKESYGETLKERRDRLRKNAEAVGSDDRDTLALRQQYAWEHVAGLRRELAEIQSRKRRLEAQLKARSKPEENPVEPVREADINQWIDQSPIIAQLESELASEQAQLSEHMTFWRTAARGGGAGDPALKHLRDSVAATQKLLKSKKVELRPLAIRQLRSQQVAVGHEDEQDLAVLVELEERLNAEIKASSDATGALNVKTLDLSALQEEVAQLKGTAGQVATEVESLTVELQAPPRVRTIEDAVAPLSRDEKKRFAMIGLIVFGSFFSGLFGVAFLELQTQKVDSVEIVPAELGLRVVGTLPIMRSRSVRRGLVGRRQTLKDRYWHNVLLESIDATVTMLRHAARAESHRVVMITSAVGSEGKTSLSSHLATSLARSGLRTLLIDADLRSPSIHRLFDLPVAPGLSELLRGEADLPGAIAATEVAELNVLTAGNCDRQTIRLLSQGSLGSIFSRLKEQFDFVIVDSSPVLAVADASIIAQQVDAVLFSIFSDVSRKSKVSSALQRLESLGVRILGAVVTASLDMGYGTYHSDAYYASLPDSAAESSSDPSS